MPKVRFYIIAALAVLLVGGQIALAQAKIGIFASKELVSSAPRSEDASTNHITPVPAASASLPRGGYAYDQPVGPNGLHPYVPAFKSDDDTTGGTQITGSPAIHPTIMGAGANEPAFTKEDVVAYSNRTNIQGIWGYPSSVRPSIVKIEFLTDKEVRQRIASYSANLPDDKLLCYVRYRGSFLLPQPPQLGSSIPCEYAFEIFDAYTGNRIAYGVDLRSTDVGP